LRQNKVLSLLGIAAKGGNVVSGEQQTLNAIRNKSAFLVFIAVDASANTEKLFTDKCSFHEVAVCKFGSKEGLGRAIGKGDRSSLAICDKGLAQALTKQIERDAAQTAEWRE
jgi:ribosomal protein L7Ae-like RNA K-turn-binding protein